MSATPRSVKLGSTVLHQAIRRAGRQGVIVLNEVPPRGSVVEGARTALIGYGLRDDARLLQHAGGAQRPRLGSGHEALPPFLSLKLIFCLKQSINIKDLCHFA